MFSCPDVCLPRTLQLHLLAVHPRPWSLSFPLGVLRPCPISCCRLGASRHSREPRPESQPPRLQAPDARRGTFQVQGPCRHCAHVAAETLQPEPAPVLWVAGLVPPPLHATWSPSPPPTPRGAQPPHATWSPAPALPADRSWPPPACPQCFISADGTGDPTLDPLGPRSLRSQPRGALWTLSLVPKPLLSTAPSWSLQPLLPQLLPSAGPSLPLARTHPLNCCPWIPGRG